MLEHAQAIEVGLRRTNEPLFVGGVGGALIEILLRDGVGRDQALAALEGRVREDRIGFGAGEIGFGLHDLLVEIGRVDFSEKLAGFDVRADVGPPILHVAADAGIYLRLRIGFQPAGKRECRRLAAQIRRRDGDDRDRLVLGPFLQLGVGDLARRNAEGDDHHADNQRRQARDVESAPRHGRGGFGGIRRHAVLRPARVATAPRR